MAQHSPLANTELDHLKALITQLYTLEYQMDQLKLCIDAQVKQMAASIVDVPTHAALMRYLYWELPEVPVGTIAEAFLGNAGAASQLSRLVGPREYDMQCQHCHTPFPIKNRRDLQVLIQKQRRAAKGIQQLLCHRCQKVEMQRQQARSQQLQTMSYIMFRKTEEWRTQHAQALSYYGASCQECGSTLATVDIYHRAEAAHWSDTIADLIVLCPSCYHIFEQAGVIKSVAADSSSQ